MPQNPREFFNAVPTFDPLNRYNYPVQVPQPGEGVAGAIDAIGRGVAGARTLKQQMLANLEAKKAALDAARQKQENEMNQVMLAQSIQAARERDTRKSIESEGAANRASMAEVRKQLAAYYGRLPQARADKSGISASQLLGLRQKLTAAYRTKTAAFKQSILGLAPAQKASQATGGKSWNPEIFLPPEVRTMREAAIKAGSDLINSDMTPDQAVEQFVKYTGGLPTAVTYLVRPKGIKTVAVTDGNGRVIGYQTDRGESQGQALQLARGYFEELAAERDNQMGDLLIRGSYSGQETMPVPAPSAAGAEDTYW